MPRSDRQALPSGDASPSKHPPSKHQVSHALMSCLFDPDPDSNPNPDQVALGRLHPGVSVRSFVEKTVADSFSPGERRGARVRSAGIICRVALSELLRRAAPSAGQGPLAGEAPWPLCARCVLR